MINYLTSEQVIEINKEVLKEIKVKTKGNEKLGEKFIKSVREIIEENRELLEAVGRL